MANDETSEVDVDRRIEVFEKDIEILVLNKLRAHETRLYAVVAAIATLLAIIAYIGGRSVASGLLDDAGKAVIDQKKGEAITMAEMREVLAKTKAPELKCTLRTEKTGSKRSSKLFCPEGTMATGGGIRNFSNEFSPSTLFQVSIPLQREDGTSAGWSCDMGVDDSDYSCFAVCCSVEPGEAEESD
mgnify:CR=1 FL=1